MAFSGASVKYKPLRVGFLVREGSIDDVVKAAGINSVLWGGIYNPLIPIAVTGDNAYAKQLMELFSVDLLYPVTETPEIQAFQKEYPYLRDPGHYAEKIFYDDWQSKKQIAGLLDSKNIVDLYWSKEFNNKPSGYKSNFLMAKWEAADPLANAFSLQFGFYPDMNFKWDYENAFIKGLCAQEQKISPVDKLTMNPIKSYGPIDLTGCELRGYGTGVRYNGNGLYIGDSDNFTDLLTFWNIRASDIQLVFLAKNQLERSLPFAQAYLDHLNSRPNRNPQIEDYLTFYHTFENPELMKEIGDQLKSKKRFAWHHVTEHSWNGMNIQPAYQVFKWQSTSTHIEKTDSGYVVNVKLPPMNFLVDEDNIDLSHQQLGVILSPYGGEYNYPGHTLKLPHIRALSEFYSREVVFDPWSLRIEHDGFSKIIKPNEDSVSLYLILKQKLVEKLFETVGIEAKTSQPGLIARKIIEKIGGIEDVRVLKIKGVRMILEHGGAETPITRGEATKIIHENDFEKHKRLYIESREKPDLDSTSVFDYLLKKNYFRAGLELVCEHCKLDNWLSLKNIDDQWACEYCGGMNQTSIHLKNRGDWKFRKSGLFAKDNHQEGAIPVLLTLLTLSRVIDRSDLTYTTALELRGAGINCETDLFVMQENRRDALEIGIGECKSEGGKITKDDCDKLKTAATKLRGLRSDTEVYIIFSKTSDNFLSEEIELFKELSKNERLVLFTNRELELYHPYWLEGGEIEKDVPERYPHSLSDLNRNSHARYLNTNPLPGTPVTFVVDSSHPTPPAPNKPASTGEVSTV
jgi:hypothetical protein